MTDYRISFLEVNGKYSVLIETCNFTAKSIWPVELQVLHGRHLTAKYSRIENKEKGVLAFASLSDGCGVEVEVEDNWTEAEKGFKLQRKIKCRTTCGETAGRPSRGSRT